MFTSCLRAPNSHQLSDTVIGGVVQRSRALNRVFYHGGTDRKRSQEVLTSDAVVVGTPPASKRQRFVSPHKSPRSVEEDNCAPEYNVERVVLADCTSGSAPQHGKESKRRLTARERNRNKQRRYRQKQYDLISSLEEDTQRLRDEINRLSKRCTAIQAFIPTQDTLWKVVVEYFRIFRYGVSRPVQVAPVVATRARSRTQLDFLQAAMTPDVTHNSGQGVDALMNSWKRFCQAFEDVEVALQGLRQSGEDSLVAKVTTSFTITKRTMCSVFPHLKSSTSDSSSSQIVKKLLGQRVTTRGTTWFQWDSALGCITGLMSETDMISPMLGLLGSLEDVSLVFEKLPVSLEAA